MGRPPKLTNKVRLPLDIERSDLDAIDRIAAEKGESRSELIRDVLARFIDQEHNRMTAQDILKTLRAYMDQHLRHERGHITQDPYRSDFFRLCKEAHRNDYFDTSLSLPLTGDAIVEWLVENWFSDEQDAEHRDELLARFYTMWNDWHYALTHR